MLKNTKITILYKYKFREKISENAPKELDIISGTGYSRKQVAFKAREC